MAKIAPISLKAVVEGLTFLPNRTPGGDHPPGWAARVADYRDGAIFVVHYAGHSEWERHSVGNEIVAVLEGETTLTIRDDGEESQHRLGAGELVIVPQGAWHRFDTPGGAKILTVTPQPTDHVLELPDASD